MQKPFVGTMFYILEKIPRATCIFCLTRRLSSVTAPQLMHLVNDLNKRVYRVQLPLKTTSATIQLDSLKNPIVKAIEKSTSASIKFGDLAAQADLPERNTFDELEFPEEEPVKDHHLRLSKTGRNHEPAWYLGKINRLCKEGNAQAATELFFYKMLTVDRVMPDRNLIHVLLNGLADVGDSEAAFRVYRKMTELGLPATNSTLSRLFRACTEDIAAWQRKHRYRLNLPDHAVQDKNLNLELDLESFAGPALERAKGLWVRLHERGFRMNRITYNTFLQTLAKAGDLHTCFQILDKMLLGRGGLPPSILQCSQKPLPVTCSAEPLPPFRPDQYTLNAVLTAVQQSFKSGFLVSPLDALHLALHLWHLILPRLPRHQPSMQHFTLLAGIAALNRSKHDRFCLPTSSAVGRRQADDSTMAYFELVPESLPKLREPQPSPSPRVLQSEKAARSLLRRLALLTPGEGVGTQPSNHFIPSNSATSAVSIASTSSSTLANTPSLDWSNPDIYMQSPVNLLLPLPQEGVRVQLPTKQSLSNGHSSFLPYQRLALFGGLKGFFECIKDFGLSHSQTSPLITKVASLLPPPCKDVGAELDRWEAALLNAMETNNIVLDLPILNVLLQRRTTYGLSVDKLMAIANHRGLSPDEFTWGCLARACRTTKQVRDFLTSYSKAAKPAGCSEPWARLGTVRPSLYIYATLLASTKFYWDSKIIILRSMMGCVQLTSRPMRQNEGAIKEVNSQPQDSSILPGRRLIANLEMDIASFRDLVARGIVPKDGSSVGACEQTGGVIIPPHSLGAFKKFIPIYKQWAEKTSVAHPH